MGLIVKKSKGIKSKILRVKQQCNKSTQLSLVIICNHSSTI